ncbi:MAG: acyltransferase [Opitutaceae bacterium]
MLSPLPVSESPTPERNPTLDGIRGVAILMVILWHQYALVPRPEWVRVVWPLECLAGIGWSGVQLFFVLSGFLIMQNLLRLLGAEGYYRQFFVRRAARILPPYFLCIATFWLVSGNMGPLPPALAGSNGIPFFHYFLLIQNYSIATHGIGGSWLAITWSLAVEVQFYLFFAPLVALCPTLSLERVLVLLAALPPLLRYAILEIDPTAGPWVILSLPTRIDAFALGALVALRISRGWKPAAWKCLLAGGIALTVFVTTPNLLIHLPLSVRAILQALHFSFAAIAGAAAITATTTKAGKWISRPFTFRPLVWLGWTSYALYLFHEPVFHLTHWALRGSTPALNSGAAALASLLALGCLLLLVEFSRQFIERPFIAAGHRATEREKAPAV